MENLWGPINAYNILDHIGILYNTKSSQVCLPFLAVLEMNKSCPTENARIFNSPIDHHAYSICIQSANRPNLQAADKALDSSTIYRKVMCVNQHILLLNKLRTKHSTQVPYIEKWCVSINISFYLKAYHYYSITIFTITIGIYCYCCYSIINSIFYIQQNLVLQDPMKAPASSTNLGS